MRSDNNAQLRGGWGAAGCRLFGRAFRAATLTYAGLSLLHEVRLLLPLFDFHASFRGAAGEYEQRGLRFKCRLVETIADIAGSCAYFRI